MNDRRRPRHADAERIQAYLDGELSAKEDSRFRSHLETCARCRSEVEGWEQLFEDLDGLPVLTPADGFSGRVLEALPRPEPESVGLAARLRGWLASLTGAGLGHLAGARLQEMVEGALAGDDLARAEEHLSGCAACREDLARWRSLHRELDALPRLAPSPDFGERVMAHVRVRNMALVVQPSRRERVLEWVRDRLPRTGPSWAAALGAAVTPAVLVAAVAHSIFSHPLVTVGNLMSFVWLEGSDLVGRILAAWAGELMETTLVFQLSSALRLLAGSPMATAAVVTLLSGATMAALWVLYRNLIATSAVERSYAHSTL